MGRRDKILLSGISGFIGSHLAPLLVERGYDVYGLVRYVTGRRLDIPNIKQVFGDIRDFFVINSIIKNVMPDIVIHLAAFSAVSASYDHPHEFLDTNLQGTVNLSEACLREIPHFRHFLFAGTSEEYGNQAKFPIEENAELRPNSPYAVSKVAADNYLRYMHEAYDFPVTILRPFNTYGRKNDMHFVVERIIYQMLQNSTIQLGDPTAIRDFMYVNDHVNAYLTCLENPKAIGDVFNFCTGYAVSIKELAELLSKLTHFSGEVLWGTIPARPLDINKLFGSYEKAKKVLGWQPKCSLEEGLKKTIEFWKSKLEVKG